MPDLHELWREKCRTGLVKNDPELLVLRRASDTGSALTWGTVFYSKAREDYKARFRQQGRQETTFDLELMEKLTIGRHGGLIIAANPNSLFPGHIVIYPVQQSSELTRGDILDVIELAASHPDFTFVHNRKNSAASIIDWAHFQAFPMVLPTCRETAAPLGKTVGLDLSVLRDHGSLYGLVLDLLEPEEASRWLMRLIQSLTGGEAAGTSFTFNLLFQEGKIWVVPRSNSQSSHAARHLGGLEMGGLFCLPSADNLRDYLPESLRDEIRRATLAAEPDVVARLEAFVLASLCEANCSA